MSSSPHDVYRSNTVKDQSSQIPDSQVFATMRSPRPGDRIGTGCDDWRSMPGFIPLDLRCVERRKPDIWERINRTLVVISVIAIIGCLLLLVFRGGKPEAKPASYMPERTSIMRWV